MHGYMHSVVHDETNAEFQFLFLYSILLYLLYALASSCFTIIYHQSLLFKFILRLLVKSSPTSKELSSFSLTYLHTYLPKFSAFTFGIIEASSGIKSQPMVRF